MKNLLSAVVGISLFSICCLAQDTFAVSGTVIPPDLLQQNYGKLPKSVAGYDLSVCNLSGARQSLVSSAIYQALAASDAALHPIGRQIMLAAILRNQNRSPLNILTVVLDSATGVLSVLSSTRRSIPGGLATAAVLGSFSAQLLGNLKPVFPADQVEKFETQVLESALVLDGGSCVERTVFAATGNPKSKSQSLSFHIR